MERRTLLTQTARNAVLTTVAEDLRVADTAAPVGADTAGTLPIVTRDSAVASVAVVVAVVEVMAAVAAAAVVTAVAAVAVVTAVVAVDSDMTVYPIQSDLFFISAKRIRERHHCVRSASILE